MDRISSILAAWKAGKLPSQSQLMWAVQWLKMSFMNQLDDDDLSPRAHLLLKDLYNLLDALVNLGQSKNPDNIIQNTIHRFISFFTASGSLDTQDNISGLRRPLLDLLKIAWSAISSENDFSWTSLGSSALREVASLLSSSTTGNESTLEGIRQSTLPHLQRILLQLSARAQQHEPYHKSLSNFVNHLQKWTFSTLQSIPGTQDSYSRLLFSLRTILLRFASPESVDCLFSSLHLCASSICDDPNVRQWFEDGFSFLHRTLDEASFVGSEEGQKAYEQLKSRWHVLLEENTSWKQNLDAAYSAWSAVTTAVHEDSDLSILKATFSKLIADFKRGINTEPSEQPGILSKFTWIWDDIFHVFLPIIFGMIRDTPIPRVEYYDTQMEFVLENLNLSTLRLHPSQFHVSNVTNIQATTTETGEMKSSLSVVTRLKAQAIRVSINHLSFWYRDKTAMYGPSDYSGRICDFVVPPQGIDLDMRFKLIPANPGTSTSAERVKRKSFHILERVEVTFVEGEDMDFEIEDCNHTVLLSLFKPLFVTRLRAALETTLSQQVRLLFEGLDSMAWDLFQMTQEYVLVGMGFTSSVKSAISDEWDHLKHAHAGKRDGTGTMFTSSGVIVKLRDPQTRQIYSYAIGSEPQILSAEKKGPAAGRNGVPQGGASLFGSVMGTLNDLAMGDEFDANPTSHQQKEHISFAKALELKVLRERAVAGWESSAFDIWAD